MVLRRGGMGDLDVDLVEFVMELEGFEVYDCDESVSSVDVE